MRKSSKVILITAVVVALFLSASAFGQAPQTLMYQGKLSNADFIPIITETEVTFRIFDEPAAGVELWVEVDTVTPNEHGIFTVQLGAEIPLVGVFDGTQRFLELQVTGDGPMTPRQPITSVPYALQANTPSVASTSFTYFTAGTSVDVVASLTLSIPARGYVILQASGFQELYSSTSSYAYLSTAISDFPDSYDWNALAYHTTAPEATQRYHYDNYGIVRVKAVLPGDTTFYLVQQGSGSGFTYGGTYYTNFVATFVPAAFGLVPDFPTSVGSQPVDLSLPKAEALKNEMK